RKRKSRLWKHHVEELKKICIMCRAGLCKAHRFLAVADSQNSNSGRSFHIVKGQENLTPQAKRIYARLITAMPKSG
ncbi:MAG: hypothetical protein EBT45_07125, partial [Alphaproteobacteria bacterium]|nr:hypothetical protein [Alphaproteobacteria bacterium]